MVPTKFEGIKFTNVKIFAFPSQLEECISSLPLITHCKYFLTLVKVIAAQFNIIITEGNTWSAC